MIDHLTDQQLTDIEARWAAYQQHAPTGFACCSAHPVADAVPVLLAEIRRLRELESAALHARKALAALCYDLDDPGSDALGALYLLSQATLGVDAPRDDTVLALARREAQVMRRCAEFVRDTYGGDETADAADTLDRDANVHERGCRDFVAVPQAGTCGRCGRPVDRHPVPVGS
ncbi:hypothetical protein TPA0906_66110 [Streptomyces olivaceus]|uniref:hypothetical protein n=1 Tax=Streptomyces olivaceus TaxID=47716 RepID=UPI0022EE96DD|nr:hypothetical protein [Streptomyces olivaceus]GHJ04746.1 hypothetical protein TPA0906_66110 [Streptomyces olivaceus]